MLAKKIKILSWNCRGLRCPQKCNVVRDVVRESRCDVCMFQETKLNECGLSYVSRFLPSFFNQSCAFNCSIGTSGGVVIAWKKNFELQKSFSTRHTLTVLLRQQSTGAEFLLTTVYGPSVENEKPQFIQELTSLRQQIHSPWILAGDFNLVRWMIDRSGDYRGDPLMDLFNDFISAAGLIDVPVKNRTYTWSNKRPIPSFSKLDRIFTSHEWAVQYPIIMVEALGMVVSDHAPLLLTCKNMAPTQRRFKIETFWLKYEQPMLMVRKLWHEMQPSNQDGLNLFHHRLEILHRALSLWHSRDFNLMEVQLKRCKEATLFFDRIEETRPLAAHEFKLRCKLKQRAYELANNLEERWRQRARINWLKLGDRNTRFFHVSASARMRKNMVRSISQHGVTLTDLLQIRQAFLNQLQSSLGSSNQVKKANLKALYPSEESLSQLQSPFTIKEIETAVFQLAKNKSSGPDGVPNEFIQAYWQELKSNIVQLLADFYNHSLDLSKFNQADVIMIPKGECPTTVGDYHPISVINLIPKLISKILSNRLREVLPEIISPHQTAFISGRQISDNFVATREVLQHTAATKNQVVFIQIDLAKAFDTIEWDFLLNVLIARGFPRRWVAWIESILSTAQSRVIINGIASEFIPHRRGLRQGDPLSPMLFNLAVDTFQQMVKVINEFLTDPISQKTRESVVAFQYADDTVVIASATVTTLVTLKMVISLFAKISGLRVNYKKSLFVPINLSPLNIRCIEAILGCKQANFPIRYLGMPLTILKPRRAQFMPLIEKVERRLSGWKGKLISRGGRMELVRSVLSSIPIYFMTCFRLPQWVINRIDRIRRTFLWGRTEDSNRGFSLTNWQVVCIPRKWGGMGVLNLQIMNIALLLRWWWKAYNDSTCLWTITVTQLRTRGGSSFIPRIWLIGGSFFWKQLRSLKTLFNWSVKWHIGNGNSISYWFDIWLEEPRAEESDSGIKQRKISLSKALPIQATLEPDRPILQLIQFNSEEDRLEWKWDKKGQYTSRSAYRILTGGGMSKCPYVRIWKGKIPPTIRIFAYLLLKGKILTRDVLRRRGLQVERDCVMCSNCPVESGLHLFFLCPYAVEVWYHIGNSLRRHLMKPGLTVQVIWEGSWTMVKESGGLNYAQWMSRFICVIWHIWKTRNRLIFEAERLPHRILADRCVQEMRDWLKYC